MTDAPATVAYGRVILRLVEFLADSDDVGTAPDERGLSGAVLLTPSVSIIRWPGTTPPRVAVMQPIACRVVDGDLKAPDGVSDVWIVASTQPLGEPNRVQWTATFLLNGVKVQPAPLVFDVPASGTVDLGLLLPPSTEPGVVTVVSAADRLAAEAAASAAAASASSAANTAAAVPKWVALGQAAYDALPVKDATTLYVITGA